MIPEFHSSKKKEKLWERMFHSLQTNFLNLHAATASTQTEVGVIHTFA